MKLTVTPDESMTDVSGTSTGFPPVPPRPSARAWATVFILQLLYILSVIDRNLMSLLVAPIKATFGVTDFQVSLLQGASFALFYATCGLLAGWLVDRYSRRWVVLFGVALWSLAAAGCGVARTFPQMIVARFGVGSGEAVLSPAGYAIISSLFPREKLGLAIGIFGMGSILGGSVALYFGGWAFGWLTASFPSGIIVFGMVLQPWQLTFIMFGLPGLVLAPLILYVPKSADQTGRLSGLEQGIGFATFLRRRRTYMVCHFIGFGTNVLLAAAIIAWLPTYLVRHFGLPVATVGATLAIASAIGGIVGFLAAGTVADRWFKRGRTDAHFLYAFIAIVCLTVMGILTFTASSPILALSMASFVYATFSLGGLAAAHLQIVTPSHLRARTSALYLLVGNVIGLSTGPSIVAAFTDFLFHDPQMLGRSLILTIAIFGPISAIALWLGRKAAREAVADAEPAVAA